MSCPENVRDLLPDYHLDQLPEVEARQVRRALRDSPECRERLAEVSEVLDRLALAAPPAEPSPSLKARVLAAVEAGDAQGRGAQERPAAPPAPPTPAPPEARDPRRTGPSGRGRWRTAAPYLGAAAAALLCVVFGLVYFDLRAENRLLREEVGSLREEVRDPGGAEGGLVVVPVEGTERASGATGTAVADPQTGSLAFDAYDLPDAPEGHAYHAWLVGQDGEATDLGRMEPEGGEVRMTGSAPESLDSYQALEVTVEPLGEDDGEQDGPVYLQARFT